ncbi:hypothetical protein AB7M31_002472 [Pseudomonas sp. IAP-CY TE4608]
MCSPEEALVRSRIAGFTCEAIVGRMSYMSHRFSCYNYLILGLNCPEFTVSGLAAKIFHPSRHAFEMGGYSFVSMKIGRVLVCEFY